MPREKIVRRTLADGSVKVYRYAAGSGRAHVVTMDRLIAEYRAAPEFIRLAPATKRLYLRALDRIAEFGAVAVAEIKRRNIKRQLAGYQDRPATARNLLAVWSVLLNFAVEQEYITASPAHRIRQPRGGEHSRWRDAQVQHALDTFPEPLRRAVLLALYSGQRIGDCIAMRWSDYDGEAIQVKQTKTGARLWIPCHAELRAELDAWERQAVTILVNTWGRPWKTGGIYGAMSDAIRADAELRGLVTHGLRKTAAARLAEAGCSVHQIAAITGHATLAMVAHYTAEADQRQSATAAIRKLEDYRVSSRKTEKKAG